MWNASYPYQFTVQQGDIVRTYRYTDFSEYIDELLEFYANPRKGVVINVTTAEPAPIHTA